MAVRARVVLLELQAAVAARAVHERRRAAARRAGIARQIDRPGAIASDELVPVAAQDLGDPFDIVLLDQEVRARPSTFAGAGRTSDQRRDVGREAALAQRLHVQDRSGARGDERQTLEQLFGFTVVHCIASERIFAGNVPTIGVTSGPAHGHGVPLGHHAGMVVRYSDGGRTCFSSDGSHIVAALIAS